jgi:hypothetical protein
MEVVSWIMIMMVAATAAAASASGGDYFLFMQTWPASVCHFAAATETASGRGSSTVANRSACSYPPAPDNNRFNVHGLWSNHYTPNNGSVFPSYCSTAPFETGALSAYRTYLDEGWFDQMGSTTSNGSTELWRHEWAEHGRCAARFLMKPASASVTPFQRYFLLPLLLRDLFRVESLVPRSGGSVVDPRDAAWHIETGLSRRFWEFDRRSFVLYCRADPRGGLPLWYGVGFCINTTDLHPLPCPDPVHAQFSCSQYSKVSWPLAASSSDRPALSGNSGARPATTAVMVREQDRRS